jgi:hypothetical protein
MNDESKQPEKLSDIDRLKIIIENRQTCNCREPRGMPTDPDQAARWWIKFLELRQDYEIDRQTKKGWVLPYQERISDCLKIYYRLPQSAQSELVAMRDRGIYWRGDGIQFMRTRAKVDMDKIDKTNLTKMMKTVIARAGQ